VLRKIFGLLKNYRMGSFILCTLHQILSGWSYQGVWGRQYTKLVWGRWEMYTKFVRNHLGNLGVHGRMTLRLILK
jgi:hypothetical protein